jgi:enoyl-CoA hydratase/carnithine racemase
MNEINQNDAVLIEEREDGICILTLNRPHKANASDPEICGALANAIYALNRKPQTRVIIITGNGKAFAAGGDVKAMANKTDMFAGSPNEIRNKYREIIHQVQLAIYYSDVPVLAAVNGAAAGAGNDLVAVCDIAIASDQARFQESFVSLGLISGDGGSWLLPRVVGKQNAFLMAYTADWFSAEEACKMGLVLKVVPHESLITETLALAQRIIRHPNGAIRATRRLIIEGGQSSFEAALDTCASMQGGMHFTNEHREKLTALLEKMELAKKTESGNHGK